MSWGPAFHKEGDVGKEYSFLAFLFVPILNMRSKYGSICFPGSTRYKSRNLFELNIHYIIILLFVALLCIYMY